MIFEFSVSREDIRYAQWDLVVISNIQINFRNSTQLFESNRILYTREFIASKNTDTCHWVMFSFQTEMSKYCVIYFRNIKCMGEKERQDISLFQEFSLQQLRLCKISISLPIYSNQKKTIRTSLYYKNLLLFYSVRY